MLIAVILVVIICFLLNYSFAVNHNLDILKKFYFLEETNFNTFITHRNSNFTNDFNIRKKRKIKRQKKYKWEFPLLYYIENGVNPVMVRAALAELQAETCLTFKEIPETIETKSGIIFFKGNGCYSQLGKQGMKTWQIVSLGDECMRIPTIQHEILHALGFFHEHSRIDRNEHLYIFPKNVRRGYRDDFSVVKSKHSNTLGIPFDYGSLLHYDVRAHSKNGDYTMLPKNSLYIKTLGHLDKLVFNDIKALNLYYCGNICKNTLNLYCQHGSYQSPKNCIRCKCVDGFTGQFCEKIAPPLRGCGQSDIVVLEKSQKLEVKGSKRCIYHIRTVKGKKIMLKFDYIKITSDSKVCKFSNSLEVKFLPDKTLTGALFCGKNPRTIFLSKDHHVILYYNSLFFSGGFKLFFRVM